MPADAVKVQGYDFSDGADYAKILGAMRYSGFQATSFGMAVDEINRMIQWRYSDEPILPEDDMQGKPDCLAMPFDRLIPSGRCMCVLCWACPAAEC
jgi:deoxyhypusine synthase